MIKNRLKHYWALNFLNFFIPDWLVWCHFSASCSPTATAATLRHLCAPFMHIENCLNLIYIMLNQGSSCVNSLSYLVAPRPQYTFNCLLFSISIYMYVHCIICGLIKDLIWFDLMTILGSGYNGPCTGDGEDNDRSWYLQRKTRTNNVLNVLQILYCT